MTNLTPEQEDLMGDLQYHEMKVRKSFQEEHEKYLKALDDRESKGQKPISFDDYLWSKAEKEVKRV